MIELAERSTGGASTTMMVLGEAFGVVLLAPFVLARRAPLFIVAAAGRDRRRVVALLVGGRRAERALLRPVLRADRPDRTGAHDADHRHVADLRHPRAAWSSCGNASARAWRSAPRVTLAGVFLATLAHGAEAGGRAAPTGAAAYLRRPNRRRRTAAPLSHWMPSVGLSSLGQASTQLVIVWQR